MRRKDPARICRAATKKNVPCKKHAMKGTSFCYIHSIGRFQAVPIWKNPTLHFLVGLIAALIIPIVSFQHSAGRSTQSAMFKQVEHNAALLDDIWISQHESKMLQKYPSGYVLFGVDPFRVNHIRSEKRMIPRKGRVLDEYVFKWDRVSISKLTDDSLTVELPDIIYTPLNTGIYGSSIGLNRKYPGRPRMLPIRPAGVKNRIFVELAYDKPSLLVFAIGFKPG